PVTYPNDSAEDITIVAPSHPVMANLTNADLSNWGTSAHQMVALDLTSSTGYVTLNKTISQNSLVTVALDGPPPLTIACPGSIFALDNGNDGSETIPLAGVAMATLCGSTVPLPLTYDHGDVFPLGTTTVV